MCGMEVGSLEVYVCSAGGEAGSLRSTMVCSLGRRASPSRIIAKRAQVCLWGGCSKCGWVLKWSVQSLSPPIKYCRPQPLYLCLTYTPTVLRCVQSAQRPQSSSVLGCEQEMGSKDGEHGEGGQEELSLFVCAVLWGIWVHVSWLLLLINHRMAVVEMVPRIDSRSSVGAVFRVMKVKQWWVLRLVMVFLRIDCIILRSTRTII